jgi:Ni/Co efflux regulator RcnB
MKRLISTILAFSLLGGSAAMAAPFGPLHPTPIRDDHRDDHRGPDRAPAHHAWRKGERLDRRYGNYTVVSDWNRYHLRRPPRGYHWVNYGGDYVLAAVATGIIADVMLNAR